MAQFEGINVDLMVNLLNDMKRTNDQLEYENDQLKLEVGQLKLDADQVKLNYEGHIRLLNDEVNHLKSRLRDYSLQTITFEPSQHVNKRSGQFTDNNSQLNVDATNSGQFVSIPDQAIHLILMRLPLGHRVHLRIICRRWKSIIDLMCASVQSLKLFGPTTANLNYNKETNTSRYGDLLLIDMKRQVNSPKFSKGITHIQFIPQLFCNVKQIVLSFPKTFEFTIMQLLESWSHRLTSLTLDIDLCDQYLGEAIWQRITQMPKVKSLTVVNNFMNYFNAQNNRGNFVGQLKYLKIDHFLQNGHEIVGWIGPNIRRLSMKTHSQDLFCKIRNRPELVANVTHLNVENVKTTREEQQKMLQFVCDHFVSLIELKFDCLHQIPFDQQLTQLSQFVHLTSLHLYMSSGNLDHDLPRATFASLKILVLNIWMKLIIPKKAKPKQINITERQRITMFLNSIPNMFPVLVELKIVAHNDSTLQFIEQFVNGSSLKSCERIKRELVESREYS